MRNNKLIRLAAFGLALSLLLSAGCGGSANQAQPPANAAAETKAAETTAAETTAAETAAAETTAAETTAAETAAPVSGEPVFNATGFPIMSAPIHLTAFWEGGTTIDWSVNEFIKKYGDLTNVYIDVVPSPDGADGLSKRNLMFASGDYTDILLLNWNTIISKADTMEFGVKEHIIVPVTKYVDQYGTNMQRIFTYNPNYRTAATAPDGEIYGIPRFSECYHCSAYPKIYMRTDWLKSLNLQMPATTEELRSVLTAFVNNDPNGNGQKDEIGLTGATTWNTMLEYALMGMAFQTVKPDFWLSLGADGKSVEISPATDRYREGLRYIKSLYDQGLLDPAAFTQKDDQEAQTVRTEPHIVGAYTVDHAGMGYDTSNQSEAEIYQIMPPVAGPDGFRRQGQNANEGEVQGYHAVITDKCKYPEAAFRFIDNLLLDDDINMERFYGPKGVGWDYAPAGTKDVFGGDAKYVILPMEADAKTELMNVWQFGNGPQADIAPFRLSMLPEASNIYAPENYEQRITVDTKKLVEFLPKKRLQYYVFVPLDMASDYSEIQTNLNAFFRTATVQFITGQRDIETGWDQYLSEMKAYNVDRYVEIYKTAAGIQ